MRSRESSVYSSCASVFLDGSLSAFSRYLVVKTSQLLRIQERNETDECDEKNSAGMYEAVVPEQKKLLNAELAVVVGADAENVPSSIVAVLVEIVGVVVEKRKQEIGRKS